MIGIGKSRTVGRAHDGTPIRRILPQHFAAHRSAPLCTDARLGGLRAHYLCCAHLSPVVAHQLHRSLMDSELGKETRDEVFHSWIHRAAGNYSGVG